VVLILWLILIASTLPLAIHVTKHLTTNGFESRHSEVRWATNALSQTRPVHPPNPLLIQHLGQSELKRLGLKRHISAAAFHHINGDKTLFLPPPGLTVAQSVQFRHLLDAHGADTQQVTQIGIGKLVTHDASHTVATSGVLAMPVLAVLLLLVFGSVAALSLPLIIALAGSEVALAAVSLISRHMQLSVFLTDIVSFLALGVGVDYALFISTRYRQNIDQGRPVAEAVSDSMAHAGRSVLYSGVAVALAVATLLFGSNAYWRGLAVGGAVAIFAVLLATHTLLPAVMALYGRHLNWGRIKRPDLHVWRWLSRGVTRHPLWALLVGLAVLIPLASLAPQITMSTPANLATMLPRSDPLRQAVEKQQQVLGAGSIAPIAVVMRLPEPLTTAASWKPVFTVTQHLTAMTDVKSVASPTQLHLPPGQLALAVSRPQAVPAPLRTAVQAFVAPKNPRLVVVYVTARTGPNQSRTSALVGRIDRHLGQWLPVHTRAHAGGLVPVLRDFNRTTQSRLPLIIASALAVALVVLTVATRSVLQAVIGVIFDALVALATAGFMVFVDHHQLLGLERRPLDLSITPLIFVLLFGLSMDYEVILLHRIQERLRSEETMRAAIEHGVATTGAMITGAGMIMVVVFLALMVSPLQIMKTLGVGLSFAVLADTWIVRSLLVPSVTTLFGRWGFWPWRGQVRELSSALD
jgi:RND superfamily putative drug exporter